MVFGALGIALFNLVGSSLAAIGAGSTEPVRRLFRFPGATSGILSLISTCMTIWYIGVAVVVIPMVGNAIIRAESGCLRSERLLESSQQRSTGCFASRLQNESPRL